MIITCCTYTVSIDIFKAQKASMLKLRATLLGVNLGCRVYMYVASCRFEDFYEKIHQNADHILLTFRVSKDQAHGTFLYLCCWCICKWFGYRVGLFSTSTKNKAHVIVCNGGQMIVLFKHFEITRMCACILSKGTFECIVQGSIFDIKWLKGDVYRIDNFAKQHSRKPKKDLYLGIEVAKCSKWLLLWYLSCKVFVILKQRNMDR